MEWITWVSCRDPNHTKNIFNQLGSIFDIANIHESTQREHECARYTCLSNHMKITHEKACWSFPYIWYDCWRTVVFFQSVSALSLNLSVCKLNFTGFATYGYALVLATAQNRLQAHTSQWVTILPRAVLPEQFSVLLETSIITIFLV